jgi:threonine/homoserine/homoserine lactone efflux protein
MSIVMLFATAFMVALSGALMPGPLLTVTVGHSPRYGWTFGPLAILGHAILELGLISLVFLGAAPLLKSGPVQAGVGIAGGAILLWMGQGMFTLARSGTALQEESAGEGRSRPVLLGIISSISNPYWTLWWATIGLAYLMVAAEKGPLGIAVFFLGHITGDLAWYTLVSVGAARGLTVTGGKAYSVVMGFCSVFLVVLGGWFLWYGFRLALA